MIFLSNSFNKSNPSLLLSTLLETTTGIQPNFGRYLANLCALITLIPVSGGNNFDNILTGNEGWNSLAGFGGHDDLIGQIGNNDIAKFQGDLMEYTIVEIDDTDGHDDYFITDLMPNRDSTCHIVDIHLLNFAGIVYEIENILDVNDPLILPTETKLLPAYPNPFNPITTIEYHLAEKGWTQLTIFDLLGRPVRTLINQQKPAGKYHIQWNGHNDIGKPISAGMYFYQLQTQSKIETHKIILLK